MTIENERALNFIIVEGVICELDVSLGKENLLAQVEKRYRERNIPSGIGDIAGELYSHAAVDALIEMYDGEDTENFVCLIDGKIVCGTFGGASKLPLGKIVRVVAEQRDHVYVARGILSESEGLVWITHAWGSKAENIANYKIAWWCFVFQFICMMLATIFSGPYKEGFFWAMFAASVLGGGGICLIVAFWSTSTMSALADPATEVFRMLGFDNPERVNLNWYRYAITHQDELFRSTDCQANHSSIHDYKKAIADGKVRMLMPGTIKADVKSSASSANDSPWSGRWGGL